MAEKSRSRLFEGLTRDTGLLALSSLFSDISTEMLYPVLPLFLTQTLGAGGAAVGLIEGFAQATQNIAQGFSGALSDRLRRRKPIALAGYALSAVSKPLIGGSTTWAGVLGARFMDRLGAGSRSAPRDALVAASAHEAHRGKAFGLEGAGDNAGAFVGPLIAVALITFFAIDLRWIFYLAVIPGLLAFLMVTFVREGPVEAQATTGLGAAARRLPSGYRRYLAATAIFGLGNSSNAFLILETRAMGASLQATILIYAAFNLVAAVISYPAGHLSDRLGRRNLLVVGELVFVACYLGFGLSRDVAVVGAMFALYGLFQGIFRAVGKALAADFAPPAVRASAVGWYSATVGLSGLVASLVAGLLWDRVSHAAVFLLGASFAGLGVMALLLLVPRRAHRTAPA
jgi:MFS family permease